MGLYFPTSLEETRPQSHDDPSRKRAAAFVWIVKRELDGYSPKVHEHLERTFASVLASQVGCNALLFR